MLFKLLKLDWLSFRRAPFWGQSMAINALMGFFAIYLLLTALGLGFICKELIQDYYPDTYVITKFNGFFAYYLLIDLIIRFLMQKYPSFSVNKYLTLNIPKSTLTRYLLSKSLLSFFNILPIFLLIPFFFTSVLGEAGVLQSLSWLGMLLSLVLVNHFLSFWMDRKMDRMPVLVIGILLIVSALIYLEYKGIFSYSDFAAGVLDKIAELPFVLIPVAAATGLYYLLFSSVRAGAYLDAGADAKVAKVSGGLEFAFLNKFGEVGRWIRLESKLIWRNKKSRNYLFLSFIFLGYPFFFGTEWTENVYQMVIFGMLMVGAFMLNYGQLLFSWNSSHFDFVITQNLSLGNFLKSKYLLIAASNIFFFVLSTPYIFINPKIVLVNFVMMLFNAGVIAYVYLWFTMNNSKKMSLEKGNVFSQEGVSAAHYFIMIPIIALPFLVFTPFKMMGYEFLGLLALATIGLVGIIFHDRIIVKALDHFNHKKYSLHRNFTK